jgi:hypothetical protein
MLAGGRMARARRLLVTTGLADELPDVPGLRDRWGRDVVHCPYCHGWEVRDRAIGVLASGPRSVHQALLFRQLSDDVTYFTHASSLTGIRLRDGTVVPREVVAIAPRMVARAGLLASLGLHAVEHPSGAGMWGRLARTAGPRCPGCGSRVTSPTWAPRWGRPRPPAPWPGP